MIDFSIRTIETDDAVTITVTGEIDLLTSGDLETMLTAAIEAGSRPVYVDARGVTFADCAALVVLIKAHIALACRGRQLVLAAPSVALRRLLDLSRTAGFLRVEPATDGSGAHDGRASAPPATVDDRATPITGWAAG